MSSFNMTNCHIILETPNSIGIANCLVTSEDDATIYLSLSILSITHEMMRDVYSRQLHRKLEIWQHLSGLSHRYTV